MNVRRERSGLFEFNDEEDFRTSACWRFILNYWQTVSYPLAVLCIFLCLCGIVTCVAFEKDPFDPTLPLYGCLFIASFVIGKIFLLMYIPELFGMIIAGVIFRTSGVLEGSSFKDYSISPRDFAAVNILLLISVGFEISNVTIEIKSNLSFFLFPTLAEMVVSTIAARYFLFLPWFWAMLLGTLLAINAPDLIASVIFKMRARRLGVNHEIQAFLFNIALFNIIIGVTLETQIRDLIFQKDTGDVQIFIKGLFGLAVGTLIGCLYGILILFLPSQNAKCVNGLRFLLLVTGSSLAFTLCARMDYPSGGPMACIVLGMITGSGWRSDEQLNADSSHMFLVTKRKNVNAHLYLLWSFLKPITYSLLGLEINLLQNDLSLYAIGVGIVLLGLLSRFLVGLAMSSMISREYKVKEKVFLLLVGCPKGDIQAVFAPMSLDLIRYLRSHDKDSYARQVITVVVLSICITLPLCPMVLIRIADKCLDTNLSRNNSVSNFSREI